MCFISIQNDGNAYQTFSSHYSTSEIKRSSRLIYFYSAKGTVEITNKKPCDRHNKLRIWGSPVGVNQLHLRPVSEKLKQFSKNTSHLYMGKCSSSVGVGQVHLRLVSEKMCQLSWGRVDQVHLTLVSGCLLWCFEDAWLDCVSISILQKCEGFFLLYHSSSQ